MPEPLTGASQYVMRPREKESQLVGWIASVQEASAEVESELEEYYRLKPGSVKDPIQWWKGQQATFPRLSRLSLDLLTVPAMASDAERAFSMARITVSDQRHTLCDSTIEAIQLLKHAIRH